MALMSVPFFGYGNDPKKARIFVLVRDAMTEVSAPSGDDVGRHAAQHGRAPHDA
jgi:hypothetical protein